MPQWNLDDTVYVPVGRFSKEHLFAVTKIGRRWITAIDGWRTIRFDRETMEIAGGGRAYRSREEWEGASG